MKAFALLDADTPAALVDLPDPEVAPDGVRIRVTAASVNGFDIFEATGNLVRFMEHRFPTIVGRDFSGVVDAVGAEWADVEVGDEVFGFVRSLPPLDVGTFAELVSEGPRLVDRGQAGRGLVHRGGGDPARRLHGPRRGRRGRSRARATPSSSSAPPVASGRSPSSSPRSVAPRSSRPPRPATTRRSSARSARPRRSTTRAPISSPPSASAIPDGIDALIDLVNRGEAFGPVAELVRDGGRIATTLGAADVDALAARGIRATNIAGDPTHDKLAMLAEAVEAGTLTVPVQQTFALDETPAPPSTRSPPARAGRSSS